MENSTESRQGRPPFNGEGGREGSRKARGRIAAIGLRSPGDGPRHLASKQASEMNRTLASPFAILGGGPIIRGASPCQFLNRTSSGGTKPQRTKNSRPCTIGASF